MVSEKLDDKAIFNVARQIDSLDARAEYLRQVCGTGDVLRKEVENLLRGYEEQLSFLESPPATLTNTCAPAAVTESVGTQIGAYKLLQQIGEGGMGVVFMAEQEQPVRRRVALKVIRPGMDSRQVIARFEAERQALAMMDHQNIARVLDAGTTDSGRPYFVMELVHGVPLTKFCNDNRLTLRQRLELFVPVCQAIQHAHQKGIIHRDIKPGNILVTMYDDKPVPKVIDFGVAKAVEQRLTEKTLFTQYGTLVGTFEYMSPEQAEMNAHGVDTRSDVYSLGVLLYELLTGTTPLDKQRLREAAFHELIRIIKEEEPERPSVRLSSSGALPKVAAACRAEPAQLPQLVRGELDWIVMKCLEKDRTRRFETVNGLARDVQRYLNDEPVEACPPSVLYRVRKLARRNKVPVLAASLVLLALIGGIVGTTWQAVRATQAEAQAIEEANAKEQARQAAVASAKNAIAAAEAERTANELAQRRLSQIEKANDILGSIFIDLDPREEEQGKPLRAQLGERLEQAAAQLDAEAVGDPLTVARLQHTLGISQRILGHIAKAIGPLEKASQTRAALLGPNHPETLRSTSEWATALAFSGQHDKSLPIHEQVWATQKMALGPEHPDALETEFKLAIGYWHIGQREKGLKMLERVQARSQQVLGPNHKQSLITTNYLATTYSANGQFEQALPLLQQTLARQQETFGPDHIGTAFTKRNLGIAYLNGGQFDNALLLFDEALAKLNEKLGEDHPEVLNTLHAISSTYRMTGRLDKAVPRLEELFTRQKTTLGPDDSKTMASRDMLALAYRDSGDYSRAEELFLEALALKKQKLDPDDPLITHTMASLGWNYVRQKRYAEAETILRDCLAIRAQKDSDKWQFYETHRGLGASLLGQQRYAEAEQHLLQGYQGLKERKASLSATNKRFLKEGLKQIVELYDAWGKPDEAAKWRTELMNEESNDSHPTSPETIGSSGTNPMNDP